MLQPPHPPSNVFETIYCDFMGPFPVSSNQNRFLLVVVDALSIWV
jgi:hypothetical protein